MSQDELQFAEPILISDDDKQVVARTLRFPEWGFPFYVYYACVLHEDGLYYAYTEAFLEPAIPTKLLLSYEAAQVYELF